MKQIGALGFKLVRTYPLFVAFILQVLVLFFLWRLSLWVSSSLSVALASYIWLGAQVCLVVILSVLVGLPRWWWMIQALLPVALSLAVTQDVIPLSWFGVAAVIMALVFSNVWRERVPLYLSNSVTQKALVLLVKEYGVKSVIDLGAGLGGVVRALARSGVDVRGVEYSPVLALLAGVWCRWRGEGSVVRGDMWQADIAGVNMVYVFLSPVPMMQVWQKVCREMSSGSLLVSNSFAIPNVEPVEVWELSDRRQTKLLIYRVP